MGSATGIRIVRTAVFTALCVTLSAGAHVLLSGAPLPLPVLAAVTAVVFVLAYLLLGPAERRFWQIAALLLPLQLAADTVFTTGQTACYGSGAVASPVAPIQLGGFHLLCAGGDFGTPLARLASGAEAAVNPAAPWLLLGAHLGVGLLAAGWLRGGEAAVARMLRAAVAAGFRPLRLAIAVVTATGPARSAALPRRSADRSRPGVSALLSHSVSQRGPPADRITLAA